MQIFNFKYFYLKNCKSHQNMIILASMGTQSSAKFQKNGKKCRFSCFGPQKGAKNEN